MESRAPVSTESRAKPDPKIAKFELLKTACEQFLRDHENDKIDEVFEHVDHHEFINALKGILSEEGLNYDILVGGFKSLFPRRWECIRKSHISYDVNIKSPINQFCYEIAKFIDEYNMMTLLMPTLRAAKTSAQCNQLKFGQFIVKDDGHHVIDVEELLGSAFDRARNRKNDLFVTMNGNPISSYEEMRLYALFANAKIIQHKLHASKEYEGTAYDALKEFHEVLENIFNSGKEVQSEVYEALCKLKALLTTIKYSPDFSDSSDFSDSEYESVLQRVKDAVNLFYYKDTCIRDRDRDITHNVLKNNVMLKRMHFLDPDKFAIAEGRFNSILNRMTRHPDLYQEEKVDPEKTYMNLKGYEEQQDRHRHDNHHQRKILERFHQVKYDILKASVAQRLALREEPLKDLYQAYGIFLINELQRIESRPDAMNSQPYQICLHLADKLADVVGIQNNPLSLDVLRDVDQALTELFAMVANKSNMVMFSPQSEHAYEKFLKKNRKLIDASGLRQPVAAEKEEAVALEEESPRQKRVSNG